MQKGEGDRDPTDMLFKFLDRRGWDIRTVAAPWGDRPSIYRHVSERHKSAGESLSRADERLPDEELLAQAAGFRWAAGALDGVFGHHGGAGDPNEAADQILHALRALTERATDDRAQALYSLLTGQPALEYIDSLLPRFTYPASFKADRVLAVARWLATESADREAVKASIAIIGTLSQGEDRDLLTTLGKHEEFTLFTTVAIQNTEPDPDAILWDLAQHVTGWGRIHIVERLAATQDPRIKAWMLRDGCRNDIMDEYTALICARTGDLVSALKSPDPDDRLMKGAGAILAALIRGGPAESIRDYPDGPEATDLYLRHLRAREADLEDLNIVAAVERFVERQRDGMDDPADGWREREQDIAAHIVAIMDRPVWRARIHQGLSSNDRALFWNAAEAARLFGIDTWEIYFDRLQAGEDQWYFVMQTDDPNRIDRVVELAEQKLPLSEIASGPAEVLGLGPGFEAHQPLDFVLQHLGRFAGKGWPLVRAGLASPVTRNRNMAVRALAAWGRAAWPAETELLLRQAIKAEPNADTRELMRKVMDSEPL